MKKRICVVCCLGVLTLSGLFTGCGDTKKAETKTAQTEAKETPEAVPEETETETPTPELKTIGTKTEQKNPVQLKNCTGLVITGVSVKSSEEAEYPENLLTEGDSYAVDEERLLYYQPAASENAAENADPEARALDPAYDIRLTFENDMVLELHAFPFGDIEKGELYAQDSVAFLKYRSVQTKENVDTKEAELAVKAAAEAQAAEAQAAEAQSEEYYEEPAYDDSYNEEYSYDEEYYDDYDDGFEEEYYEEPSYDDGGSGDDACLDGGLVY